jgi:hypothetical protein
LIINAHYSVIYRWQTLEGSDSVRIEIGSESCAPAPDPVSTSGDLWIRRRASLTSFRLLCTFSYSRASTVDISNVGPQGINNSYLRLFFQLLCFPLVSPLFCRFLLRLPWLVTAWDAQRLVAFPQSHHGGALRRSSTCGGIYFTR